MKIIAHRSASKHREENSVDGLLYAAQIGADMGECDVTLLKDGTYVIYHDDNLMRLAGRDIALADIGYEDMKAALEAKGKHLVKFEELLASYDCDTPILLHIKMKTLNEDFVEMIRETDIPFIFGVVSVEAVRTLSEYFPPERILAFMPKKNMYEEFFSAGAGNIRLWEPWLRDITPDMVKQRCRGCEVWIMACDKNKCMDGSRETLDKCLCLGVDGILLDDIHMALEWRAKRITL